ncbi:MAG: ImmA/IrrE family metallo-endopeptidase [Planctomycetota bacterium]
MERISFVNAQRVVWACQDRGITVDELAEFTHIALATLKKVVSGVGGGLTFSQLQKLAAFFNRGVLFFLDPGPVDATTAHSAAFRTITNQKPTLAPKVKSIVDRVEKYRQLYLELLEDLETESPKFKPPKMYDNPSETARSVRRWLGLGIRNDFDSYRKAIESKGVLVFRSSGYAGKWQIPKDSEVSGLSIYYSILPVILVRAERVRARQSFTLAHELGHLLLHQSSFVDDEDNFYSTTGREREANQFAGHFLMPDELLAEIPDGAPTRADRLDDWLKRYRADWGVSTESILVRLVAAGRLPKTVYSDYKNWQRTLPPREDEAAPRLYRHREPIHILGRPFVQTVLDAMSSQLVTMHKAGAYLDNLKMRDLHQLESYCASTHA